MVYPRLRGLTSSNQGGVCYFFGKSFIGILAEEEKKEVFDLGILGSRGK